MPELVEDVLDIIFDQLTPLDWIHISEVCHFWKTVVEKQWEKIVEISYNKGSSKVIPAKDALKIVQQAARFCKVLKSYTSLNEHQVVYIFGSKSGWEWHYKFEGFSIFNVLEVLAENAKEITEVHFPESPRTYLLGDLINSNKVKTVSVVNPDELWQNIPTDGIENLDISIDSSRHFESFKGHFRNLQRLKLGLALKRYEQVLSGTLPYVLGIKSLNLDISNYSYSRGVSVITEHITKCTQLEELSIQSSQLCEIYSGTIDIKPCSKLRVVKFEKIEVKNGGLHSLLSLPNLEKLHIKNHVSGFRIREHLPAMKTLLEFVVEFQHLSTVEMTNLCNAIKMMPKLQRLEVEGISKEQNLMLAYEAIIVATLQEKDVIITAVDDDMVFRKFKIIESLKDEEKLGPILSIDVTEVSTTFYKDIVVFVQERLKGHRVFMIEEEQRLKREQSWRTIYIEDFIFPNNDIEHLFEFFIPNNNVG